MMSGRVSGKACFFESPETARYSQSAVQLNRVLDMVAVVTRLGITLFSTSDGLAGM